jgi:hypothetical protein
MCTEFWCENWLAATLSATQKWEDDIKMDRYLITLNMADGYGDHRVSLWSTSSAPRLWGSVGSLRTARGALITAGRQMTAARVTRAINNCSSQLMCESARAWTTTLHQLLTYVVLRIWEVSCSNLGREALYCPESFPWSCWVLQGNAETAGYLKVGHDHFHVLCN